MITNNTSYKLKAAKSTHNIHDFHHEPDENESVDGDAKLDLRRKVRLNKQVTTNSLFHARPDRRNAVRNKTTPLRKTEFEVGLFPYSKYEAAEKKAEVKFNLPEDTRISKLLRRLSNEEDADNSLQISKKLLDVLMLPDNASYVRKSFAILRDSILHILHVAPGPRAKKQCARAFGRIGYIMAHDLFDFGKYVKVIVKFNLHGGHEDMVCLFMEALKETLALERKHSVLDKSRMYCLMNELILSIEPTDNVDVFKLILDNLMTAIEFYPSNFNEFFKDTIDLLFGWHVDHTQPLANIEFISTQMQRVAGHFQRNIEISRTLIIHFLEDIDTYSEQTMEEDTEGVAPVDHVTVYVLALNTVLKCWMETKGTHVEAHKLFTKKLMTDALKQIMLTIQRTVAVAICDNLIIAANESVSLLLTFYIRNKSAPTTTEGCMKEATFNEMVMTLLDDEITLIDNLSDSAIISLLALSCKVIKELSADLDVALVPKLIGPASNVLKLRYQPYRDLQEATISVYQALLNVKNIPLLQAVYKFLLGDLQTSYKCILKDFDTSMMSTNPFDASANDEYTKNAQGNCLFLLRCLSQIANDSGSLLGMWILKPSILEVLAVHMQPYHTILAQEAPILQYSILYLLYSHCKCYNFFISSSDLLNMTATSEFASTSPNSGNFSIVLRVLGKTFTTANSAEVKLLLLQWFNEILIVGEPYLAYVYQNTEFVCLIHVLQQLASAKNHAISIAVAKCLEKLLANKQLAWRNDFFADVHKLCRLHMTSTSSEVRNAYTMLSACVPWDVVILECANMQPVQRQPDGDLANYSMQTIQFAKQLHMKGSVYGEMPAHCFRILMNFLLKNEPPKETFLEGMFASCWPLEADNQELSDEYRSLCLNSQPVLYNWATWEAAQFCINNKLRTPLGKANETFTSFENALKQLARDVMKMTHEEAKGPNNVSAVRVRLLLQFIEHLEMAIYNASEGTTLAMPAQISKTVRTFFSTNASTCREWLSRIRIILVQLALHAGENAVAVRHGQLLIADLHNAGKCETIDFQRTVVYLAMGLLNLQEPEALQGLYVWCKATTKCSFEWIKCAVDQAARKYEQAIDGYQKIIQGMDSGPPMDIYVKHFINDQIFMCFQQMNSWLDIIQYNNGVMNLLLADNENGMRYSFSTMSLNCAEALHHADSNNFEELTSWKELDDHISWSSYDTLRTTQCDVYNIALNLPTSNSQLQLGIVESKMKKIQLLMQENALHDPIQFSPEVTLLNYVCQGINNVINTQPASTSFLVSENFETDVAKMDCTILSQVLWWSEYFGKLQNQCLSTFSNNLRLNIIKKSRKEGNTSLATTQLHRFLSSNNLLVLDLEDSKEKHLLANIADSFQKKLPEISVWSLDSGKAVQNIIKLLYDSPTERRLAFDLSAMASTSISKSAELYGNEELKQVSAKILLKLAGWLQTNEQVSFTEITSPLWKLLMVLPEIGIENIGNKIIPINEMVIGKLLQFSVSQCATLAKSWHAFGTWCYRWGRKIVDSSADLTSTLTEEDTAAIQQLLPVECTSDDFDRVLSILSQTRAYVDEDDIDSNEIHTSDMIRNQLKNVAGLLHASEECIDDFVQMWRRLQKRVYAYYGHSVEAYFKYLQFATNSENVSKATESNTVTVTLRLLRLIVKHALELQKFLEVGLASTPTQPWKIIIPQLFSRLNHPESYVRERVSELLCRVAEDAPHLITFPAVVGAMEGGVNFDFSEISLPKDCLSQNNDSNTDDAELNDIEDSYESDNDESKNVLQACFKSMVDTLSKQAPETITQVQLLVKELRRIILLWDELWLGTLAQHHGEINKRQQQLEMEIEKVNNNSHLSGEEKVALIAEKHRIIIKPIIFILEQLYDITSAEPETPHEKHFQEKYLDNISKLLAKLKNPNEPQDSWKVLKELQSQFQHKAHKRSVLKMDNISPTLANIRDTVISMPGQEFRSKVCISHVSTQVSILPTKTRPKKLIFHGSDGQTYTYLFKGLEDLHLDERIMQFLSIANIMMAQNTEGTGHNLYRAKHYSVIPLGPRSGLISWVSGTTPVFSLYKRWQQREANKTSKSGTGTVARPSELFYNKLNPLLQEHGVKNIENRKEWPLVVLKQVLSELMAETPSNLLAKELWCHSVTPAAWWQMVRKYTYSVAVMSIIGYIIGLGDRHLDNVLVDLNTGELVHIDYNVCFEKGKTLRVPEKVPFRLTPNFRDALGVTGVEGMFRLACENILRTMKKGRETLLTLLEAFVYDPLVDWTIGNDGLIGTTFAGLASNSSHRQTRKDLEKEVTLSMYRVRCTEIKTEWENNKLAISALIPELFTSLDEWATLLEKFTKSDDVLQDLHQQMALVKEAEANGFCKHSLHTLPARYEAYKKKQETFAQAQLELQQLDVDCSSHIEHFDDAVKIMQSPQVQQWYMELSGKIEIAPLKSVEIVKEFLLNAGQSSIIAQCEQIECDVNNTIEQQLLVAQKCLNFLKEYWLVMTQLPPIFIDHHRAFFYQKWSKMLLSACDSSTCDKVYQQFFAFNNLNAKPIKLAVAYSYNLNHLYNSMTTKTAKAFEDMNAFRADESVAIAEKRYAEAKMCLKTFLNHEKSAFPALQFVVVSELLVLNRTFLTLETAASKTGDWLIKLTSRDGDWFLDELTLSCSKAIELVNYLQMGAGIEENRDFTQVMNGLTAANNLYISLHELNFNFHTIILPESIKKIQSEEASVLQMIHDLDAIIVSVGPLQVLSMQLEKHLTCVVMEMDYVPTDMLQSKLAALKCQYLELLHSTSTSGLSAGKMLLMGFNGLFDKLHLEANNLVTELGCLNVPHSWRKLDQVREAKSLAAPICNTQVHAILDDIFLLKRLQTMSEFFALCMDTCRSFKGIGDAVVVLDDEQLLKPIRKFIADFISRQFLGISTEAIAYVQCYLLQRLGLDVSNEIEQKDIGAENKVPLDELYHIGWNAFLKNGVFTQNLLAQASSIESNVKIAWEKLQEPKKLEKIVTLCQSSLTRIQNQLTAHNWLHEELLAMHMEKSTLLRSKFLMEFRNKTTTLTLLQSKTNEMLEKQKTLSASVSQRLKWAVGANPDLNGKLEAFETIIANKEKRQTMEKQICARVLTTCMNVLHFELLRYGSSESKSYDQFFLSGYQQWEAACHLKNIKIDAVTPVEENIMNFYTPQMAQDPKWILLVSEKISETIPKIQNEVMDLKSQMHVVSFDFSAKLERLKSQYNRHCSVMNDFKNLIKSMMKIDDCAEKAQDFLAEYRSYIDNFSSIFQIQMKKENTFDDIRVIRTKLEILDKCTNSLYGSLLELESAKERRHESSLFSPLRALPLKQESMTKGQQRNTYAMGVWSRVRMKLEGKDPDPGRKYTTQEQVDYVIREALSLDNLALLYEGWTPWV